MANPRTTSFPDNHNGTTQQLQLSRFNTRRLLAELGATAERLFPYDPASCVLKLRLLAESLTQEVARPHWVWHRGPKHPGRAAARRRPAPGPGPASAPALPPAAPAAATRPRMRSSTALATAKGLNAHQGGARAGRLVSPQLWQRRRQFKPGPFVLPDDPSQKLVTLQQQIAASARPTPANPGQPQADAGRTGPPAGSAGRARTHAGRSARRKKRAIYQQLAEESSQRYVQLQKAQDDALCTPHSRGQRRRTPCACAERAGPGRPAGGHLDEAATRRLIDQQLIEAGWQADTQR
jgi:type I restriction enzyme R subunit